MVIYQYNTIIDVNIATVWKNGLAINLNDGSNSAKATSVYVNGDDVYVVGNEGDYATVWKGIVTKLTNNSFNIAKANAVFVK